ncbi:isoaspartyl peptidase/L-asparaginase [Sphingomonas aerolata]
MAGACTTSGMAFKMRGRVGDSPQVGSGLYVEAGVGGATSTGLGEEVTRVAGRRGWLPRCAPARHAAGSLRGGGPPYRATARRRDTRRAGRLSCARYEGRGRGLLPVAGLYLRRHRRARQHHGAESARLVRELTAVMRDAMTLEVCVEDLDGIDAAVEERRRPDRAVRRARKSVA